jgi:predicted MFS family arabinose efflux permease
MPADHTVATRLTREERAIVLVIAAVQFVNILDFVIVMPMGPDFAKALGFAESRVGWLAGAYTGAAAAAGFAGSFFLDRFDRRRALLVALGGLIVGTAMGAFAWDLTSLMAARVIAGLFGGPATSVALAIVADAVPPARRGTAMGMVMGAFGAASVLGVPLALVLAEHISWQAPFWIVALVGVVVAVAAATRLPPMRAHLAGPRRPTLQSMALLLGDRLVLLSYTMTATVMFAGFIVIPNISAYVQENLGYPRGRIGYLYLVGGAVSFLIVPWVGKLVDRWGSTKVGAIGSALAIGVAYVAFYHEPTGWPVMPFFVWFMAAMGFRNVAYNTLTSKVPVPELRANFMSLQSTVQHAATAAAGFAGGAILGKVEGHMTGMPKLAMINMVLSAVVPAMLAVVEAGVRARAARAG